ncbi:ArnT family glycosyltransferase [Enhygromyxa salina]|uniref:ArnT family glycosyltransferase n=1 Tax=Enhygromyxa salina TaxID=215803 RepID=UPI0011B22D6C|nr:hypothetical protein [Enhygromyxa salina]
MLLSELAHFTYDDAYISYRYARNLAEGHGLVFNIGERVEGYTNFAWTLILAIGYRLGLDPDLLSKVLGGAAAVGAILVCYLLSRRILPESTLPPIAPWLLATSPVLMGHSVFGLESGFFSALMILGVWMTFREEKRDASVPWSGLVFALGGLTRPEAPMFIGLTMLFLPGPALWTRVPEDRRPVFMFFALVLIASGVHGYVTREHEPWLWNDLAIPMAVVGVLGAIVVSPRTFVSRRNILRGLGFVIPVGGHMLWRHSYYGAWLPNTLGAKTGDLQRQVVRGTHYVTDYFSFEGPILWFALIGIAFGIGRRNREVLCVAAIAIMGSLYTMTIGSDWMKLWRFMAHLQPEWLLLAGLGVRAIWSLGQRVDSAPATAPSEAEAEAESTNEARSEDAQPVLDNRWVHLGLVAVLALTYLSRRDEGREKIEFVGPEKKDFLARSAPLLVEWFQAREEQFGRDEVEGTIALADIGKVSYLTNYPILDLLGLVDPKISKLEGGYKGKTGRAYRDYFFAVEPRYHLTVTKKNDCLANKHTTARPLMRDPRYHGIYEPVGVIPLERSQWCIYERREDANRVRALGGVHRRPTSFSRRFDDNAMPR